MKDLINTLSFKLIPVVEKIELFEHTLDKKVLVWFQEHKDKFVDLTTLKTMFLQRYNP